MRLRSLAAVFVAAAVMAALTGSARADGDPASDVLITKNVFLPYPAPAKETAAALTKAVAAAFARRYRVKVAVIASPSDLGAVPQLFNKPTMYARFLASEIDSVFVGPLLIVMPAGFGIYDGGRSTAAEERVLATVDVGGPSADSLTQAATTAVRALTKAGALRSKDIRAPYVYPELSNTRPGETTKLRYRVLEDSERSREVVRVYAGKKQLAVRRTRMRPAEVANPHFVKWRVPNPPPQALRYCVVAIDPTGNVSRRACADILIIKAP